jgi:hypothetical protein
MKNNLENDATSRASGSSRPVVVPTYDQLLEALTVIAHFRCDGDEFFCKDENDDAADISNDHLQDQMAEAICLARETLGISVSGPTRAPTDVHRST